MPGIFHTPHDRRSFLKFTTGGVALTVAGCASSSKTAASNSRFHVALLSDTHVPADRVNGHRGFNPWKNLESIVPKVVESRPEAVILNGDAARLQGQTGDYKEVRALLEPVAATAPIYIGMGNHDNRENFASVFASAASRRQNVQDKLVLAVEHPVANFIILDSLETTNKTPGLLGEEQRAWLSRYLESNREKPVVIFLHHTLKNREGDLKDADAMFAALQPHPQVKAIFYGHSHVWAQEERQGIKLVNLPAVGYNFRDTDPVGWVDATFDSKGADLTLHAFGGNQSDDGKTIRVNWA